MSIKLARYKNTPYIVNFEKKKYTWAGCKGKSVSIKEVSEELVDFLTMQTKTFEKGELVILETEKNEEAKEYVDNMLEKEQYEANTLSKEEITTLLTGNYKKMEKELNKITSKTTKDFVLAVAQEIGLDSATKQSFIKEWLGSALTIEELFDKDEE